MEGQPIESLYIESKDESAFAPRIHFDAITGICVIEGESCLENAAEFYNQLMDWFKEYAIKNKKPVTLNLRLRYFNTSSSKCILDMLKLLKNYKDSGGYVHVNWYYLRYDADQLEEAEDYVAYTQLPMNIIPIDDED